jgi:hypothetical protein
VKPSKIRTLDAEIYEEKGMESSIHTPPFEDQEIENKKEFPKQPEFSAPRLVDQLRFDPPPHPMLPQIEA